MATRNINNYINELLNENKQDIEAETRPKGSENLGAEGKKKDDALVAAAQKDFDRYDRIEAEAHASADESAKEAARIRAMVDAGRKESEEFKKVLAAYKEKNRAGKGRADDLKSGQGTNQEREERITDSQRAIMSDNAKSIASSILKGFGAGRSTDKPRESFPSRGGKNKRLARAAQADETGDAYADQVMGQGKGTPSSGADIEKFKIEKDKQRVDARPIAEPKPFYPGRRPDNRRPIGAEPMAPGPIQLPGGRYDDIRKPIGKPIDAGTFKKLNQMGKNKRLARAAQADETGDAYADQVMKTGAGKTLKGGEVKRGIIPTALGNVGAVNPFTVDKLKKKSPAAAKEFTDSGNYGPKKAGGVRDRMEKAAKSSGSMGGY
tara:strand:+ start:157 stop:1293 length:1137 start_codon:yes stop_codon:yes gene_type:complete